MALKKGASVGLIFPSAFREIATVCGEAGKQAGISIKLLVYEMTPLPWNFGYAVALSRQVDVTVVFTDNASNNFAQQRLVQALPPEHTIVVALRSPYDYRAFPYDFW